MFVTCSTTWTITGAPLDLHNPRLIAIAQVERPFFEADYDDYAASGARAAAFCRSAILIVSPILIPFNCTCCSWDMEKVT